MIKLFYHIKKNVQGIFTYHEFRCGWNGFRGVTFGDVYKTFNTHAEALSYAKERGGVDAYSY